MTLAELQARVGKEIGTSDWLRVSQERIDRFADATDDHQFIHVDPARAAKEAPFGGTIAHGFLTLSLLSKFAMEVVPKIDGRVLGINYGFERIRFLAPVRSGARIRGRFTLHSATLRSERELLLRFAVTVEIENEEKPALAADWLTLSVMAEPITAR
ncbi:MAG: MaoC family dehydratase [Beijerinckiaceae bacterium]